VQQLEIDQSVGPMQGLPNSPATMVTPFIYPRAFAFLGGAQVVVGRRLSYRPVSVRIFGKEPRRAECSRSGKPTCGFRSGEGHGPLICAIAQSLADIWCAARRTDGQRGTGNLQAASHRPASVNHKQKAMSRISEHRFFLNIATWFRNSLPHAPLFPLKTHAKSATQTSRKTRDL